MESSLFVAGLQLPPSSQIARKKTSISSKCVACHRRVSSIAEDIIVSHGDILHMSAMNPTPEAVTPKTPKPSVRHPPSPLGGGLYGALLEFGGGEEG